MVIGQLWDVVPLRYRRAAENTRTRIRFRNDSTRKVNLSKSKHTANRHDDVLSVIIKSNWSLLFNLELLYIPRTACRKNEIPMRPCGHIRNSLCRCQEVQFGKLEIYGVPYIGVGNRSQLLRTYRHQRGWTCPVTEQNFKFAPLSVMQVTFEFRRTFTWRSFARALCCQSYLDLISSWCATFVGAQFTSNRRVMLLKYCSIDSWNYSSHEL